MSTLHQEEGTELKTLDSEAQSTQIDLVSCVAHELRNPLTVIMAYASLLERNVSELKADEILSMAHLISRNCRRMNALITDILDVAILGTGGQLSLRCISFDLVGLCERVIGELSNQKVIQSLITHRPIDIKLEHPEGSLPVCADPDKLEQVLINLLSNAVKYSPHGGTVTVRLYQALQDVVLEVCDTGIGMTSTELEHLFEKFYRTPTARSFNISGIGIGLHLVKQIVLAHGGRVEVESQLGEGTLFRVLLPQAGSVLLPQAGSVLLPTSVPSPLPAPSRASSETASRSLAQVTSGNQKLVHEQRKKRTLLKPTARTLLRHCRDHKRQRFQIKKKRPRRGLKGIDLPMCAIKRESLSGHSNL